MTAASFCGIFFLVRCSPAPIFVRDRADPQGGPRPEFAWLFLFTAGGDRSLGSAVGGGGALRRKSPGVSDLHASRSASTSIGLGICRCPRVGRGSPNVGYHAAVVDAHRAVPWSASAASALIAAGTTLMSSQAPPLLHPSTRRPLSRGATQSSACAKAFAPRFRLRCGLTGRAA
jgi:hypothetical protein